MFALLLALASHLPLEQTGRSVSSSTTISSVNLAPIRQSKTFEDRLDEAGEDIDALWSLYLWCDAADRGKEGKVVLRKIVDLDPSHRDANTALGHIEYHGQWFPNQRKLDKFKRDEEEREATEKGLVRFGDEWVSKRDLPYLEKGLVRGPSGDWVTSEELALLEQGWARQDLQWIAPEEVNNIEQGLWKCGDAWLSLEHANRYHAKPGRWWMLPGESFRLYSTLEREVALEAAEVLARTVDDLIRAYGRAPAETPTVILLRNKEQYTQFAKSGRRGKPTDGSGVFTVHYAFLADEGFDPKTNEFWGAGVGCWDNSTDAGRRFGRLAARHAAGQAFAQGVEPSPKAVKKASKKPGRGMDLDAFYAEKTLPQWYRFGASTFVERYFVDSLVPSDGNPHWAKAWSVSNLMEKGGLIPLPRFFESSLDVSDDYQAGRWINQSGLVMAFILDGGVTAVDDAHAQLLEALATGKRVDKALATLEQTLQDHMDELLAFSKKQ
jgi:hypothetical protein